MVSALLFIVEPGHKGAPATAASTNYEVTRSLCVVALTRFLEDVECTVDLVGLVIACGQQRDVRLRTASNFS